MQTDDWEALNDLVLNHIVHLVPPGADDDLYILHYARKHCCFVVSNDYFTDHIATLTKQNRSSGNSMKLWIDTNRNSYMFVHHQTLTADTGTCREEGGLNFMLNPACPLARSLDLLSLLPPLDSSSAASQGGGGMSGSDASIGNNMEQMVVVDVQKGMNLVTSAVQRMQWVLRQTQARSQYTTTASASGASGEGDVGVMNAHKAHAQAQAQAQAQHSQCGAIQAFIRSEASQALEALQILMGQLERGEDIKSIV